MPKSSLLRAQFRNIGQGARLLLIRETARGICGRVPSQLNRLLLDVIDLYEGKWPSHQACQVSYHTLDHALEVTLATARMIAGWNRGPGNQAIGQDGFLRAMAACLFHDSGYIKEKGDHSGKGGKFTFSHVERSMALAGEYLREHRWPQHAQRAIPAMISLTDFSKPPAFDGLFDDLQDAVLGRMVASADIIAQMADVDYMSHLNDLFDEFAEAYAMETTDALARRGVKVFASAREMLDNTRGFYDYFVVPRLEQMGRMDRHLVTFFGKDRNPYLENIDANLAVNPVKGQVRWRRLGEILEERGLVTQDRIEQALAYQKHSNAAEAPERSSALPPGGKRRLLAWLDSRFSGRCLGDILLENQDIAPGSLRMALLSQVLPEGFLQRLRKGELIGFLEILVLLQHVQSGPWVIPQALEIINGMLGCEASTLLLNNPESNTLAIHFPTGPRREHLRGMVIPNDKGLAGWVLRHGRPAVVESAQADERFDGGLDREIDFVTRSILAVPVSLQGECIGVLEALNKKEGSFAELDMDILTVFATFLTSSVVGVLWLKR